MRKLKGLRGTGKRYPNTYNEPDRPIISIDASGNVVKGLDHHHIELLLRHSRNTFKRHPLPIPDGFFRVSFTLSWG